MHSISRRSALKTVGACLGMTAMPAGVRGQVSDTDGLQRWVEQTAIRTDPAAEGGWSVLLSESLRRWATPGL